MHMSNPVYRLDEDDIIEMARGIVMGDRVFYTADAVKSGAPLWLLFADIAEEDRSKIGMVVGNLSMTTGQAINGHPVTSAGWIVHEDDAPAVRAKIDEYLTALGYDTTQKEE